jgi:hypothetical protein
VYENGQYCSGKNLIQNGLSKKAEEMAAFSGKSMGHHGAASLSCMPIKREGFLSVVRQKCEQSHYSLETSIPVKGTIPFACLRLIKGERYDTWNLKTSIVGGAGLQISVKHAKIDSVHIEPLPLIESGDS